MSPGRRRSGGRAWRAGRSRGGVARDLSQTEAKVDARGGRGTEHGLDGVDICVLVDVLHRLGGDEPQRGLQHDPGAGGEPAPGLAERSHDCLNASLDVRRRLHARTTNSSTIVLCLAAIASASFLGSASGLNANHSHVSPWRSRAARRPCLAHCSRSFLSALAIFLANALSDRFCSSASTNWSTIHSAPPVKLLYSAGTSVLPWASTLPRTDGS